MRNPKDCVKDGVVYAAPETGGREMWMRQSEGLSRVEEGSATLILPDSSGMDEEDQWAERCARSSKCVFLF